MASTISSILWPLYLHDVKNWGSQQYSYLIFTRSLLSVFVIAFVPSVEIALGKFATIFSLALWGAVATIAFYFHTLDGDVSTALHIVVALSFYSVISAVETSLKSLASLNTPPALVASAFGVLALLGGLGNILGNLTGTYLYTIAKTSDTIPTFLNGARLPFLFVSLLLVSSIICVSLARKPRPESGIKNRHIQ